MIFEIACAPKPYEICAGSSKLHMSAQPGHIKIERRVDLAQPRHYSMKTTPEFSALKAELMEEIRVEVRAPAAAGLELENYSLETP